MPNDVQRVEPVAEEGEWLASCWFGAAEWIGDCIATSEKIFGFAPPLHSYLDSEMTSQISCRKERDKQMRLSVTKGEKRRTMERVLTLSRVPMELLSPVSTTTRRRFHSGRNM